MQQLHMSEDEDRRLQILGAHLSPNNPIRQTELLRGRDKELASLERELRYFQAIPFIYGDRGVGKTSLASTAAQQVTASDREHVYVACARGGTFLQVLREVAEGLLKIALRTRDISSQKIKTEFTASLTPSIKLSYETQSPNMERFENVNDAFRAIREIDGLLSRARETVVIIDELEVVAPEDQQHIAYLVKQIGDQELQTRFILVGIGENVTQLMGAHPSAKRYIKEVELRPLGPQVLMDIVSEAARLVEVTIDQEILYRIAIIGNGYPHFAHLMGKALLVEAITNQADTVTPEVFERGVGQAVQDSIEELRTVYDAATMRRDDVSKHLVWALADKDVVDVRIDEWIAAYRDLAQRLGLPSAGVSEASLRTAIRRLGQQAYGAIVKNTPKRYGSAETTYRYKRFAETLMRGHVRLQAMREKVLLGRIAGL